MELPANAQNKNAPGTASEGIRVSSEDRVTDLPLMGQSVDGVASFERASRERARVAHGLRGVAVVGDVASWG